MRRQASLLIVAAALVLAALPAAGDGRSSATPAVSAARLGLVTSRDLAGLAPAAVPGASRQAWASLLPVSSRSGAAVSVLRGRGTALVSRAARTQSSAQAAGLARTLRRLSAARLARLDAAVIGRRPLGHGRAHAVWNAGSLVGQISVLGTGRPGASLARAAAVSVRVRVAAALAKTAWDKVLDQVRPDGRVTVSTALQAFSLAIAPLPGVRVPAGPARIPDGTLAINWVLAKFSRLTAAQQAAVTQAFNGLHGATQHAFRLPASAGARSHSTDDWQPNVADQKIAETEASAIGTRLGFPLTLNLHVGTGAADGDADGFAWVSNAQGNQASGPPTDCWVTVNSGKTLSGTYLQFVLAHEVFHCFQGQIDGVFFYNAEQWVIEGGANWAACNVVPKAADDGWWAKYLASPSQRLFERTYDGYGFFSLLSQHGINLWSRWPAIIHAAFTASYPAYANAVGAQQTTILDDWAASYAQDSPRGPDWDVAGPCKPEGEITPPTPVALANGTTANLAAATWTVAVVTPFSSADVVHVTVGAGHLRLSAPDFDRILSGEADYCTSAQGDCTCPGSAKAPPKRINAAGGALIALTGGPTGAEATVTGMSLDDYCQGSGPSAACELISAKQLRSILDSSSSILLDKILYSSDPALHRSCQLGAWSGPKPTTAQETLQRARSGKAAAVAYETWTQGGGPNAGEWPREFAEMVSDFEKGIATLPGPFASLDGRLHTFEPPHFGHPGKGFVMAGQGLTKGLVGAGGCWWESSTDSAICLVDIEAVAKPVVAHANQLAAIAVPKFLG